MKTKDFLITVLFAVIGTAISAQVGPKHFQQEKSLMNRHHQMPGINHEFNNSATSEVVLFDEFQKRRPGLNDFLPEGEILRNAKNTNDLWYACDSAFSYTTTGEPTKTIHIRDAEGRSFNTLVQTWNSGYGIWVNSNQVLYSYTASDYLKQIYQEWDIQSGAWVNSFQYLFSHDASGERLSYTQQDWDKGMGAWINTARYSYTYNDAGQMLSILSEKWDTGIGNWLNIYKKSYTFDALENRLSFLYQYWDTEVGDWLNKYLYSYTYDDAGNMLSELRQNEEDIGIGNLINIYLYSYTYDDAGNRLTYLRQNWDNEISDWVNIYLCSYTYDVVGNRLTYLHQDWDNEISDWVNRYFYSYTYDAEENELSELRQDWYTIPGQWVNSYLLSSTYDTSGNMLSYLNQYWESGTDVWVNISSDSYAYDALGNMLLELYQNWDSENWQNEWKTDYEYDYNSKKVTGIYYEWSGEWISIDNYMYLYIFNNYLFSSNGYKAEAYYSSYSLGIEDEDVQTDESNSFCNPNPANDLVNVTNLYKKEAVLKIYNMNGQLVNEKLISTGQNQVSVQNLSPGIYLFVMQSENSKIQNKVVVY